MRGRIILDNALFRRTAIAVCVGKLCDVERCRREKNLAGSSSSSSSSSSHTNAKDSWTSWMDNLPKGLTSIGLPTSITLLDTQHAATTEATIATANSSSPPGTTTTTALPSKNIKRYDFVIIGNGIAGRTAVETLQSKCPSASIALIDPLRQPPAARGGGRVSKRVEYIQDTVLSLDPRQRRIGMFGSGSSSSSSSNSNSRNDKSAVEYKYGVLIATGSHGAPPPSYLIDAPAQAKVWELRPTVLTLDSPRPSLPPMEVRKKLLQAAKKGQSIGILGSSWDAVELAVATGAESRRNQRPTLLFGASGPLSHHVPNYLSSAIAKRLKQKRIHIQDRTLIRYINHDESAGGLQIYSARSFDFLDSTRTPVDQVVVATDTMGPKGNAALPTDNIPNHLLASRDGRFWYKSWSQLSMSSNRDPSMIVCYKDDGRIAVNSELCACSGVYAAGSVAKCGNALTGHADVAGQGIHDASVAGRVAALNMARHYQQDSLFSFADGPLSAVTRDSMPVWRSDVLSYDEGKWQASSLSSIGIHALCVGTCDSERYATHGVWWTNQSAQQRIIRLMDQNEAKYGDGTEITPVQYKRRKQTLRKTTKMVYGFGVVYYLDRTGRIQGVMLWGLPFAESSQHDINPRLLERVKEVILTNGGLNSVESELDQMRMSEYLADASRALVSLAFTDSTQAASSVHQLDRAAADFPRPLHRFTDIKPMSVRSHGVLKRKDGHSQGILGEDLFSRFQEVVPDPSPPKPVSGGVGYASEDAQGQKSFQAASNWYDYQVYEQQELRWTENESIARPPKEDAIWIRKGDENRNVSAADNRMAIMGAIFAGSKAR